GAVGGVVRVVGRADGDVVDGGLVVVHPVLARPADDVVVVLPVGAAFVVRDRAPVAVDQLVLAHVADEARPDRAVAVALAAEGVDAFGHHGVAGPVAKSVVVDVVVRDLITAGVVVPVSAARAVRGGVAPAPADGDALRGGVADVVVGDRDIAGITEQDAAGALEYHAAVFDEVAGYRVATGHQRGGGEVVVIDLADLHRVDGGVQDPAVADRGVLRPVAQIDAGVPGVRDGVAGEGDVAAPLDIDRPRGLDLVPRVAVAPHDPGLVLRVTRGHLREPGVVLEGDPGEGDVVRRLDRGRDDDEAVEQHPRAALLDQLDGVATRGQAGDRDHGVLGGALIRGGRADRLVERAVDVDPDAAFVAVELGQGRDAAAGEGVADRVAVVLGGVHVVLEVAEPATRGVAPARTGIGDP